jgi:hypothetical protein
MVKSCMTIPFDPYNSVIDYHANREVDPPPPSFLKTAIHDFKPDHYDWILANTTGRFSISNILSLKIIDSTVVHFEDSEELAMYTLRFL